MTRRTVLVTLTVLVVVAVAVVVGGALSRRSVENASGEAAQRYVELIASAQGDDLETLWAMTYAQSPGALREAGRVLVGAEQRIEVRSVGTPTPVSVDEPIGPDFDHFVAAAVRYRLDGTDHRGRVVLGRLTGETGSEVAHWRVVEPLTGSVQWEQPGFADIKPDLYVSGVRQVRTSLAFSGSEEDEQPLYPAVYAVQTRMDPYFAAPEQSLAVPAGKPVAAPDLTTEPTQRTVQRIRRLVRERIAVCERRFETRCPAVALASYVGVDYWTEGDWWRGLAKAPHIEVGAWEMTLSGGAARIRTPSGRVRTVPFTAHGRYLLNSLTNKPIVWELELEAVR